MAEDEIEGMYSLVGDPESPDLEAADAGPLSLTDRIKQMTKRPRVE
jgi:hypothetical protein